ncbi:MAG: hypothetical protein HOL51_08780 [Gemmatimonadetes bacterium]|nr:hypothetical protein [Gemmatimonadota bacterium]MBT5326205.1 hypothetical protein [Gemmatimonadota bacterium]MBT5800927.1 hypothetical protein [Gemmatimonadota bacterium]MBT7419040.1 hypothetical protein [Gemmatimonadota bacterium]
MCFFIAYFAYLLWKHINLKKTLELRPKMEDLPGVTATPNEPSLEPNSANHPTMYPTVNEEVETSIRKDGISYVFESRSVSAVLNFVYTPIDGTFADIELEINNNEPIIPAEDGGISVEMGGSVWPADSEEVERHFVSCDQVGDTVEARWQWKLGEEQANFLYRLRITGKTLVVEIEGGNGKGTGLKLGQVSGAVHPQLIAIPYFNLGENYPHILCSSGYFLSSFIDWHHSGSTALQAPTTEEAQRLVQLNGGCSYASQADGKRNGFQERWMLTASTQFDEVLPTLSIPGTGQTDTLAEYAWYNIPHIKASEESYVEIYENLRSLKRMGLDHLLVNHPDETWHDEDGNDTLTLTGAEAKGGDDALSEYLDALKDLGYKTSLQVNYRHIATSNPLWNPEIAAQLSDGSPAPTGPDRYLLKQSEAQSIAPDHGRSIIDKYKCDGLYVSEHAEVPPWEFNDFGPNASASSLADSHPLQQSILSSQSKHGIAIGKGGNHWLYGGVLNGYLARIVGADPSRIPPLVDFDLNNLHPIETDAGIGTIEQYFAGDIPQSEKHSRSAYIDRYLAATVAFGHACLLPDQFEWGIASTVKSYFLLQELQKQYLRVPVSTIEYHHNDQLLNTNDALLSGAYTQGQIRIVYENGLEIHANLGWEASWAVQNGDTTYTLAPGSFCAWNQEGLLVYSADTGSGRIDYAECEDYLFVDTRGQQLQFGPVQLDGAAVIKERKWKIDVVPFACQANIEIDVGKYWPNRKLPRLRLLAFKPESDDPYVFRAEMEGHQVSFKPDGDAIMYRITLPEWMVEPGQ